MTYTLKKQLEDESRRAQMEALFHAFGGMSLRIKSLGGIVQNDIRPTRDMVKEWLDEVQDSRNTFDALIEQTTAFLLTKGGISL